jgi:pimeloyl-ACP methyl ester carboxylesterase
VTINYVDLGGKDDECIVLLSGLGASVDLWQGQFELVEHDYRLIVVDFLRDVDIGNITIEYMATCVIHLLEDLKIDSAHICGISLGGCVAQEIYNQKSSLIKTLILSNSVTLILDDLLKMSVNERKKKLDSMTNDEYIEDLVNNCIVFKTKNIVDTARNAFTINRKTYVQTASVLLGKDYSDVLRSVKVPVLICVGIWDATTPMPNQLYQYWLTPRARIRFYCSGHLSCIEEGDRFNRDVLEFLKGVK